MSQPAAANDRQSRAEKRREKWRTIRRNFPDAMALARPQAKLWMLGLFLMLFSRTAALVLPAAPKFLLDQAIPNKDMRLFGIIVAAVVIAAVVQGVVNYVLTQTISKAGQRMIADLRVKIHNHVSRLPIRYFDNHKTGEVVSRVMNDVEGIRNLVGTGMVEFLGGILSSTFVFFILLYLNWKMTVAIIFALAAFLVIVIKAFSVLGPIFRERQKLTGEVSGRLTESIAGIRVVKAYATENIERRVFAEGVGTLLSTVLRTINAVGLVALTTAVSLGVLGAALLFIGGREIISGEMTQGEFMSYVLFLGFMIAPLSSIMMIGTNLSEVFAGIERMNEVLKEKTEDEGEEKLARLPAVEGTVEFDKVSFEYDPGKTVLHDISFKAEPGTVTAIVGPSGSGKSTLIGLVASFLRPTSGQLLIDGKPLSSVRLSDYRGHLGAVLQENFLFAGTVRENILYARPDATEEQMRTAAKLAHCEEFVSKFPDGYESVIGERGVKVSGGQRQRLAIARALVADPRILILDEATSALDSESEAAIQEGLERLMEGRTTFVIAHRLSTIRHAHQILVLEDGRLIEQGTHAELLAKRGRYFDMYSLQHGIEENLFLAPGEKPASDEAEDVAEKDPAKERRERTEKISRMVIGE